MKEKVQNLISDYLEIFKSEKTRQEPLLNYLKNHNNNEIIDWNNFDGHLVAGGFIYSTTEKKFLVLYHNDLKMYLYPGGHIEKNDANPLEAAKREIKEETNLENLTQLKLNNNELIPLDIDTHIIPYNENNSLPEHIHFEFRYLFLIDNIENIVLDSKELTNYKWIDIDELQQDVNYGKIATKIKKLLNNWRYL